jgi:hypothetical protein
MVVEPTYSSLRLFVRPLQQVNDGKNPSMKVVKSNITTSCQVKS